MPLDRLLKYWAYQFFSPETVIKEKYRAFKKILQADRLAHLYMARLEEIFYKQQQVDCSRVGLYYQDLSDAVDKMVSGLQDLAPAKYGNLKDFFKKIDFYCRLILAPMNYNTSEPYVFIPGEDGGDENLLGGKGANLVILQSKLNLPVPAFFIITTHAFCHYLETHGLNSKIKEELSQVDIQDPGSIENHSANILSLFAKTFVPKLVSSSIRDAMTRVFGAKALSFSVRSSAVAEDRESSFAGQYETMLNVDADKIESAYKNVLKSKYKPSPIYYRIKRGYCDLETPMAAIVQEMTDTLAAGVGYSKDPDRPDDDHLTIYAAAGKGEAVVSGSVTPDEIRVDKKSGNVDIIPGDGIQETLSSHQIDRLVQWLLDLEQYFGHATDMEWCLDSSGQLKILQARALPLLGLAGSDKDTYDFGDLEVIAEGGVAAASGCGFGRVHRISAHEDLSVTPLGAVLVAHYAPPDFVEVFERVSAIVTEKGSAASHCASVARELGIPFLCRVEHAMVKLREGMEVTVDADNMRIYKGMAQECKKNDMLIKRQVPDDNPLFLKLVQLIKMVSQLSLLDIHSDKFRPEGCRSIHDVIRFVHESAMREMFFLGKDRGGTRGAKRLITTLPINFYVLDVGGGLRTGGLQGQEISMEQVLSKPMNAFWKGLSDPSVRWSETEHYAWEDYDAVVLAGGIVDKDSVSLSSYAVLASDYMNLNIRFGYHFVQIDALAAEDPNNNYITFRFSGGGGRPEGKMLRARLIEKILRHLGFKAVRTGDLVEARLKHAGEDEVLGLLVHIGRLIGATRLLDMHLSLDMDLGQMVSEFMKGRSSFFHDPKGPTSHAG